MSNTSLVEEEYILRRKHEYEEETFNHILFLLAEKYNTGDYKIQEYLGMRRSTIEMIERDGSWHHDKEGFVNRSDFEYKDHQISFQTNRIARVDGYYTPTETDKAKKFYDEKNTMFALLGKIENVLDRFYEEHKEEVDTAYDYCMGNHKLKDSIDPAILEKLRPLPYTYKPGVYEERLKEKVLLEKSGTYGAFNKYGGLFIHSVITILNELDSEEDLKGYVNKFVKTYGRLVSLLEPNEYDRVLSEYERIPYIILRIVEKYSIKGRLFATMAKEELRKIDGTKSFDFETPTEEVPGAPKM